MWHKYPYTDAHELNLDWFLKEFKTLVETWEQVQSDWNSLHDYVQNYFDNLNVQTEINNKINAMIADGSFALILTPLVEAALPTIVDGKLPAVVASQIGAVVASQIDAVVAGQLPAVAASAAAAEVSDWLAAHIDPDTGYVIDDTLTVSNAAADAKAVGLNLDDIREDMNVIADLKYNFFESENSTLLHYYTGAVGNVVSANANSEYWCGYVEVERGKTYFFPRIDFDLFELDEDMVILNKTGYTNYQSNVSHTVTDADCKYLAFSIYKYAGPDHLKIYTPSDYIVTKPGTDVTNYIKHPYELLYNENGLKASGVAFDKVYYVGGEIGDDYSSFTACLRDLANDKTPKTIYVRNGVYDIYNELGGSAYLATIGLSDNWKDVSVIVPDNTKVIGLGDVTFVYRPPAADFTIGNQVTCVSVLNVVWNCEIENIKIFGNNCRYCIHDEAGSLGDGTPKRKKFKNVIAVKEPNTYTASYISGQAYASGMIVGYSYEFENCYFKSNEAYCWTSHTGEGTTTDSGNVLTFKNCIFESPSWAGIRFGSTTGTPEGVQKYCKVSLLNCYIQNRILLTRADDSSPAPNQYELWLMNCNNVTIKDRFAEEGWTNIYTPKIYNTIA